MTTEIFIPGLEELETSTKELLEDTKYEVKQIALDRRKEQLINGAAKQILNKLKPLLEIVTEEIKQLERENVKGEPKERLLQRKEELKNKIKNARLTATEAVDAHLYKEEEFLIKERARARQKAEATQFRDDCLQEIPNLEGFFDVINYGNEIIMPNIAALRLIGAFEEVVEVFMSQFNKYFNGEPVEIKGHQNTLEYVCTRFTQGSDRTYARPSQTQSKNKKVKISTDPADAYAHLNGTVCVFGGHKTLEQKVRTQLRRSQVELHWTTVEKDISEEAIEKMAKEAHLFILIATITSDETARTVRTVSTANKIPLAEMQTRGLSKILEAITIYLTPNLLAV